MPRRDGYPDGVPCWVDLTTPDVDTATGFYGPLFDWEFRGTEDDSYLIAVRGGRDAAGLAKSPHPSELSSWSTYFAVDDIEATLVRIERAGGDLLQGPTDIDDSGRLAFAADPTGARFGIWEAGTHFGAAVVNEHGALNWNELVTTQPGAALVFYPEVFGHEVEAAEASTGRKYWMLKVASREIAGVIAPRNPQTASHWTVYLAVDDAATAADEVEAGGGRISYGPVADPGVGTFLGIADPLGARLNLIELDTEID